MGLQGQHPSLGIQETEISQQGAKHSCPTESCRGHLVRKRGRFGEFLGCSEYPRCRYSCSVAG
ncbi:MULTISPECIES: topoisomerase DNA-binding C4 zinc finger domain-containing protein [Mesorhizobium]|uniref:topoisomerase DNA-binding C4 zinc finger domain-containing protein n=1 Tax=Mesorhizobium TaxID=68287 RepID=UPI003D31B4FC